jgi:hypothetical protein
MTIFARKPRRSGERVHFLTNSLSLPLGEMDNAQSPLQLQRNSIGE